MTRGNSTRRPFREIGKPFAIRTVELIQALQLVSDSIKNIRTGEIRYLSVLSGQLRSLVAERSKKESPLLLEVAGKFDTSLAIYCMPGVDESDLPADLKQDIVLHVAGFPVSIERQHPAQRKMLLNDFLDQDLILFSGTCYTPRNVIEWYANKAGGAHYSSRIPDDFAQLMMLNIRSIKPVASLLVQIGESILAAGIKVLKSVVDLEIYALVAVPVQKPVCIKEVNYLFDFQYQGSRMQVSIVLDSRLTPSFLVTDLKGDCASVVSDRMIDWSEPRLIQAALLIEDDLSTTLELSVDDVRIGRCSVKSPLFVLSDPVDYEFCCNKAVDGQDQEIGFGVGEFVMIGREAGPEERANMLLYMSRKRTDPNLQVVSYSPRAFGVAKRGTKDLKMSGETKLMHVKDLLNRQ